MPRPPKPEFLVEYETWHAKGAPKCCHTCDHFSGEGFCYSFSMSPPDEFIMSQDVCPSWEQALPF